MVRSFYEGHKAFGEEYDLGCAQLADPSALFECHYQSKGGSFSTLSCLSLSSNNNDDDEYTYCLCFMLIP